MRYRGVRVAGLTSLVGSFVNSLMSKWVVLQKFVTELQRVWRLASCSA